MQNSTQNYQSNKQYKYTAVERADYHRQKSLNVSKVLEAAALEAGDDIAFVLAQRIKKCASPSNRYTAKDLNNQSGECFDGFGNLFPCGAKLCYSCMAKAARRNKKIAEEALKIIKLERKSYLPFSSKKKVVEQQRLRMITLTMPKVFLSCVESTELVIRAFDLFRKLKFTETYFAGYIKTIEFTTREDDSYHSHIHLLAACFFIPETTIKRLWRRCVQTAFIEKGLDWRAATKNLGDADKLNVNLELTDSNERSLIEVCKYLTKSESWENIPASHLLEIANIKRWRRMFELSGCFKRAAQLIKAKNEVIKQAQREAAHAENRNYLDTKCISAAESLPENSESEAKFTAKKENWRDRVKKLGVDAYLTILERQIEITQRTRKELLAEKYPLATFTDLAGFVWYEPDIDFVEGFTENSMEMRA